MTNKDVYNFSEDELEQSLEQSLVKQNRHKTKSTRTLVNKTSKKQQTTSVAIESDDDKNTSRRVGRKRTITRSTYAQTRERERVGAKRKRKQPTQSPANKKKAGPSVQFANLIHKKENKDNKNEKDKNGIVKVNEKLTEQVTELGIQIVTLSQKINLLEVEKVQRDETLKSRCTCAICFEPSRHCVQWRGCNHVMCAYCVKQLLWTPFGVMKDSQPPPASTAANIAANEVKTSPSVKIKHIKTLWHSPKVILRQAYTFDRVTIQFRNKAITHKVSCPVCRDPQTALHVFHHEDIQGFRLFPDCNELNPQPMDLKEYTQCTYCAMSFSGKTPGDVVRHILYKCPCSLVLPCPFFTLL